MQVIASLILQHAWTFVIARSLLVVLVAGAFPSYYLLLVGYQRSRLPNSLEVVLRVKLYAHDILHIVASPIEIHPSVIIQEQVGVVCCAGRIIGVRRQFVSYQFPSISVFRVGSFPQLVDVRCHPVQFSVIDHGGRSVEVHWQFGRMDVTPMLHIIGAPVAVRLRDKQVVPVVVECHHRVGSLPVVVR